MRNIILIAPVGFMWRDKIDTYGTAYGGVPRQDFDTYRATCDATRLIAASHMCQFIRRGAARTPIKSRYEGRFSVLVYSKREFPLLSWRVAYGIMVKVNDSLFFHHSENISKKNHSFAPYFFKSFIIFL